jgi:hypothetical protein
MTGFYFKLRKLISGLSLSFEIRLSNEVAHSVALIGFLSLLIFAAYYSKEDKTVRAKMDSHGIKIYQKPVASSGKFTPMPRQDQRDYSENVAPPPENTPPVKLRQKQIVTVGYGYYYERVRVQGDAPDGANSFGDDDGNIVWSKGPAFPRSIFRSNAA